MKNPRSSTRINQAVCSLEGLCAWFQRTPGDFAVVIHGERDCGNVVLQGTGTPGSERFFCTQLDERSAVAGVSGKRLEECLQAVCTKLRPEHVFVLGTCTSALIGDDLGPLAERIAARTSVPVSALPVTAMRFVDQNEIADRFAVLVVQACQPAIKDARSINLVGFDPGSELRDHLQTRGVHINRCLGQGSSLHDWCQLPTARLNVLIDQHQYAGLLALTRERFGQQDLVVPYPVGVSAPSLFIRKILEALALPPGTHRFA